jgi:hypothetical protein
MYSIFRSRSWLGLINVYKFPLEISTDLQYSSNIIQSSKIPTKYLFNLKYGKNIEDSLIFICQNRQYSAY